MTRNEKTNKLVLTALMMSLVVVCTMFIKIPTASGYVHLGTMVVFLSIAVLGVKYGCLSAALGTALADVLAGYASWAPGSFVIVLLMTGIYSFFISRNAKHHGGIISKVQLGEFIGILLSGIVLVVGYYIYGALICYGWAGALVEVPANILQFLAGIVLARILGMAICKTSGRKVFEYPYIKA